MSKIINVVNIKHLFCQISWPPVFFKPDEKKRLPSPPGPDRAPPLLMTAMLIPTSSSHFFIPISRLARKKPRQTGFLQHLLWLMVLALMLCGMGNAAAAVVDLSVSAYLQTPSPVPRGGEATFSVTVTNNEDLVDATGNVRLAVELPGNVDFSSSVAPAGCTFNLLVNPKLLSCVRSGLPKLQNWNVEFKGIGLTAAAVSARASVSFDDVDTDNNSANNVSIKTLTVIKGADLRVGLNGTTGLSGCPAACTAAAGATVGYSVDVTNAGPESASQFKVTFDLPAGTDFTYGAATGTGWACAPVWHHADMQLHRCGDRRGPAGATHQC